MKKIQIKEILSSFTDIEFVGDENSFVSTPIVFNTNNVNPGALMWCNDRNIDQLPLMKQGTVICTSMQNFEKNNLCNYIVTKSPRLLFANILRIFFEQKRKSFISSNASIDVNSHIGKNFDIGDFSVIQKNVKIGENVSIGCNTVILADTEIGDNVVIGSNCTIGGVGFGYEKDESGTYISMPHIGNVVIGDNVEIGNNTAIDKAVLGSTVLGDNVKVDNLVHIAHGVVIGRNSLIIANAMIAGSVLIGENVWVAPSSSIINKVSVGDNATIGLGCVVLRNVNENDVVVGNPGKRLNKD
jgi:UDP-3-O-[3-hydroxymyristoyl] glucosamine N-acyltransferase